MRLFVAVDVPDVVKDAIESDAVAPLREVIAGAKWTRPEGRHLTLKFLGETPDERVPEITAALHDAVRGHHSFEASFAELGGFPTARRPRVLWLGIGEGADAMRALAEDVERTLHPLGFEPEERPFRAHYTLARFPNPRVIAEMPAVVVPSDRFAVSEIVLFRSQLHPKGARYTALEHIPLA